MGKHTSFYWFYLDGGDKLYIHHPSIHPSSDTCVYYPGIKPLSSPLGRSLRGFMSFRDLNSLTEEEVAIARALPIYECHVDPAEGTAEGAAKGTAKEAAKGGAGGAGGAGGVGAAGAVGGETKGDEERGDDKPPPPEPQFSAIHRGMLLLEATADVPPELLNSAFLRTPIPGDTELLKRLGVETVTTAAFYRRHVFKRLSTLSPVVRDAAMARVLQQLGALDAEDSTFSSVLRETSFVPTSGGSGGNGGGGGGDGGGGGSGGGGGGVQLRRPCDLYDPERGELVSLLGEECFPHGLLASPESLGPLRRLGMQAHLTREGVLESARSIVALEQQPENDKPLSVMSLRRSADLLTFLDRSCKALDAEGAEGKAAEKEEEGHMSVNQFWTILRGIPWIAVLAAPPEPMLPWQTGGYVSVSNLVLNSNGF